VFEVAIVLGALGGAYVLRQRGVGATGSEVSQTGPDPVIAAIPVLIGGAAALLAVRVLPLPLDVLSRLAEKGRGLVAVLALRRATRRSNDRLLLTALLTMAAVWSFAVASISYLDRASTAASWQRTGAAYRVSLQEGVLPPDLTIAAVPGVEKMAYATQLGGHVAQQGLQVSALALDLSDYQVVSAGGWPEGMIPGSMLGKPPARATAPASPAVPAPASASGDSLPAIVSTALAQQEQLKEGDVVSVVLNGVVARFSVAAILDSFPTLDAGSVWVVVGRDQLAGLLASSLTPTEAFIRADSSAADAIANRARYELPGRLILMNRYEVEAGLRDAPGFLAAMVGLIAVSLAVAIYGALAVLAALLLAGAERSREAAHLHVLGLSRRQGAMLGVLEHGPTSLLMIAAGIALGIALFAFLLPSLGLGTLVGGQIEVGLSVNPQEVGLVAGAVCLVVGVAIGIEALAQSIIEPAAALRRGMD
jgi:putative ABC transport system permease protein